MDSKKLGRPPRFALVDAMRGIAAMWVVLFHAYEGGHLKLLSRRLPGYALAPFQAGHFGVPIFFVLSGFVIAHSTSRRRFSLGFVARFAARRSARLDPPYWASMVFVVAMGVLSARFSSLEAYSPPGLGSWLAHMLYLQDVLRYPQISPVYWTLALEIQFYLVFCLLMVVVQAIQRGESDRRALAIVFGPAMLLAAAWPIGLIRDETWPGLFPPFWHGFLLGMLACWGMNRTVRPMLFYFYAGIIGFGSARTGNTFPQACAVTATILMIAAQAGGISRLLGWGWLQFLGLISYSLYLIHNPITGAAYYVGYRLTGRTVATECLWLVAVLAINVLAASCFWFLLERPSLAIARRIRSE